MSRFYFRNGFFVLNNEVLRKILNTEFIKLNVRGFYIVKFSWNKNKTKPNIKKILEIKKRLKASE